ncbi:uncharacterized protein LOC110883470 [Helianthus annuus]|uniref:uncharacterized protein LOC110883470 n=1 Tax=Helianthus annuus TaxID=4232 RepID=UPI000B90A33F|nr:uncharacterized protein LOC110883470 [Helianthus annuus]
MGVGGGLENHQDDSNGNRKVRVEEMVDDLNLHPNEEEEEENSVTRRRLSHPPWEALWALQEIQFSDVSGIEFEKFCGAGKFEMDHVPVAGRLGRVVSMWDASIFKDFDEVVHKAISNFSVVGESNEVLMKKLKRIREVISTWKKEVLSKEGDMEMSHKEELEDLESVGEERELSEEEEWTKMECLKDLNELEGYKIKDIKQKARARWDLEGDENTAFFHGYTKSRRAFSNIPGLMIDDVWTTKPALIKKEILGFFRRAFKEKVKDRPKLIC